MDSILLVKLFSALAYPAGLLLVLAVFSMLFSGFGRNGLAKFCRFGFVAVLVGSTNPMAAGWLASTLEQQYPQHELNQIPGHDAIIVLGGGLRIPRAPAKHTQLTAGSDRYWHAAQLFRAGKAEIIFLAGGNVFEQIDDNGELLAGEAFYARQLLIDWGIPESAIVAESASRTTEQNQEYVTTLLQRRDINSALLVTSAIHMPRAIELFKNNSIRITPASADVLVTKSSSPPVFNWLPSASAMQLTTQALHEYYGLTVLYLRRQLNAFMGKS